MTVGFKLVNGRKKREYARKWGFKTKRDAEVYLRKMQTDTVPRKTDTLIQLYELWSTSYAPKISQKKQSGYRLAWKRLEPVSLKQIKDISLNELQAIIQGLTFDPAADIKNLLSQLYKRAIAQGFVVSNLAQYLEMPKRAEPRTEKVSLGDINKLWTAWAHGDFYTGYILLMIYTGMMPAELRNLQAHMIDWQRQEIVGCGVKTDKRRKKPIVFPDFLAPVLHKLAEKGGKILPYGRYKFYAEFRGLKERLGLSAGITPYSARRFTGTELALKNVPPAVILDAMRQTQYQTTLDHYTLIDTSDVREALNQMAHPNAAQ